jgi:transcriptional regulator with XRE-family HTH domain
MPPTLTAKGKTAGLIFKLRKGKGWTQEQLAKEAKISIRALRYYEGRVHLPSLPALRRLADALEVSITKLLN